MKRILLPILCLIPFLTFAFETQREHLSGFDAKGIMELEISNQHGNITFIPSHSDSITVKTSIIADVIEYGDTGAIFRNIVPQISKGRDKITIKTIFGKEQEYTSLIHVHYFIEIPDTLNLDITNRFGNILLFDVYGTKNVVLEYGKIYASKLTGPETELSKYSLHYGEIKADSASSAQFFINSSSVNISHIKKAEVQSIYSYVMFNEVEDLTCTSKEDRYQFNRATYAKITGEKTSCFIDKLERFLELELSEGEFQLVQVDSEFTDLNLYLKNTNSDIGVASNAAYFFNAIMEYGELTLPEGLKANKIVDVNSTSYNGEYGSSANASAQIGIVGEMSQIQLKSIQ